MLKKIPLSSIIMSARIRKNLGDVQSLAESIDKIGLLSPIVVNQDNKLLAGERRVAACKFLGWDEIDAIIKETTDAEREKQIEFSENKCRKNFTREEEINFGIELERIEKVRAQERIIMSQNNDAGRAAQENFPMQEKGQVRDIVAKTLGISGKQYEREKFILQNKDYLSEGEFDDWNCRRESTNKAYNIIKKQFPIQEQPPQPKVKEVVKEVIKEVTPQDYNTTKSELSTLKKKFSDLTKENKTLSNDLLEKSAQINQLRAEISTADTPDLSDYVTKSDYNKKCKEAEAAKKSIDELRAEYDEKIMRLKSTANSAMMQNADTAYDFWLAVDNFVKRVVAPLNYDEVISPSSTYQDSACGEYIERGCNLLIDAATDVLRRFKTQDVIDIY